jgi:hypothetical protein
MEGYSNVLADGVNSNDGGLSIWLFNLPQPLQTLARLAYAALTPIPRIYNDMEWTVLGLGAAVQFVFFPFALIGIIWQYRNPKMTPILVGSLIIFYGYVMGTFTFRHISQWFPFAALFGVVGYQVSAKIKTHISRFTTMVLFVLLVCYGLIKG